MYKKLMVLCLALAVAAMSLPAQADYKSTVLGDNPVAFYEFEDATSAHDDTCADSTGNHDALYLSTDPCLPGVTLGPGLIGNAATFHGSVSGGGLGEAVHIPGGSTSGLELLTFSVEFMVKSPFAQDTYQRIYSHKDGYEAEPRPEIIGGFGDARQIGVMGPSMWYSNYAPSPVFDDAWHQVAVSWAYDSDANQTTLKWYFEGSPIGSTTQAGALDYSGLASWADPMIASNGNPGYVYNCLVGSLDEVSIYDYALTDAQVLAHYNAIPEPTTIALLGLGAIALIRRRK
jgi:hypothetical protein